ncbi:MAG: hypothetical protein CM15mV13_1850 [uncultured marine virus]|nr:MAG: hypothetical protein CM15mV13_1850 [uncultured marine virus]
MAAVTTVGVATMSAPKIGMGYSGSGYKHSASPLYYQYIQFLNVLYEDHDTRASH